MRNTACSIAQTTVSVQLSYTLALITATSGHKQTLCAELMVLHNVNTGPPMHTGLLKW